ncbi:MAG: DUF1036 domain-containing protein [Pseudomonadota bacterium]
MIRTFATLIGAGTMAIGLSTPAQAELRFCNDTDVNVSIAIGYLGGDQWTSEGWWNAGAGQCVTVVDAPAPQSYYYWHAVNEIGTFKSEDYYFCAVNDVFTIIGDTECAARGHDRLSFTEVQIAASGEAEVRLTAALAPEPPAQAQTQRKSAEPEEATDTAPQKSQETAALAEPAAEPAAEPTPEPAAEPAPEPQPATGPAPTPTLTLAKDIPTSELLTSVPLDFPAVKRALLGEWTSNDNPGQSSKITRARFEDFKDGAANGAGSWRIAASCPGHPGAGMGIVVTYDDRPAEALCMVLDTLSDTGFTLRDPGRGDVLTYSR